MTAEWMVYARAFFALLFVAGLIFLCAFAARKFGLDKRLAGSKPGARRLEVVEALYLDPRHRLVLVRMADKEHLLLLGTSGNLLIESRIRESSYEA